MCAQAPKDAADFSAGLLGIGTLPQVRGQSQLLADIAIAEASFRTTPTAQTGPPKIGVIEAVEDTRGRFILGVQWHPECGRKDNTFASLAQALLSKYNDKPNDLYIRL